MMSELCGVQKLHYNGNDNLDIITTYHQYFCHFTIWLETRAVFRL
jgi:hypothetical protein